jgi:hypothetical protein
MIVHNPPSFGQTLENERESSVWLVLGAFQFPATQDDCHVGRERRYLKIGKSEHAHLRTI